MLVGEETKQNLLNQDDSMEQPLLPKWKSSIFP